MQAKYIAKKNGLDDIKTVGLPILPREYAFAVSKGDTLLLNTINAGLTRLHRSGDYEEIFESWFGKYNPTYSVLEEGFSIFWLISLFLTAILVFVYLFMRFRLRSLLKENRTLNNELKQTNMVLKEVHKNETLLKRIIEFSPFPIAMIHEEGYFVFTNSGFEDLFGKQSTKGGSVNRWLSMAIKKEQERSFIKSQFFYSPKDIVSQGASNSVFSLTTKGGAENLMQLFFVSLGNGQLLIFFSDNANKFESTKQFDSLEKEKSKGTKSLFLPHFSHDVRSPMNIIMGFVVGVFVFCFKTLSQSVSQSVSQSFMHSFICSLSLSLSLNHQFIHYFIHPFTHSLYLIHSLMHSSIHALTHSLSHSIIHSFIHSFIHSLTH